MSSAKIEVTIGALVLKAEGEQDWLTAQLDKLLAKIESIPAVPTGNPGGSGSGSGNGNGSGGSTLSPTGTLAAFLKATGAESNQVRKFLSTALWLRSKGLTKPTTSDVSKALKDNHQTRLGNATQCLNENVKKGFCEKDGRQFYVTPEGESSLGLTK